MPDAGSNAAHSDSRPAPGARRRLVLLAFLTLFLELALIRWAGSDVIYLAYFTNFILLGSFLGIGIGFLAAKARRDWFRWAPAGLAVFVLVVAVSATRVLPEGLREAPLGKPGLGGLPAWIALPAVFLAVAAVMALVGQGLGRAFAQFEPLRAYRLDIIGSLLGIAVFSVMSFLGSPPLVWGIAVVLVLLVLSLPKIWITAIAGTVILLVLGIESFGADTYYSPYYRINLDKGSANSIDVSVNGVPHQIIAPIAARGQIASTFFAQYGGIEAPKNVLIIGAGTGPDTAVVLARGAEHVDAVEIDPTLIDIGRALHPDRPYQDPRVTTYAEDGRSFLERTNSNYDLIMFALPDSLTLVTGQSALRLEGYLLTKEAFAAAKSRLTDTGTFALFGYFPQTWMADRTAGTLWKVFGLVPCTILRPPDSNSPVTMLVERLQPCTVPYQPTGPIESPATDDRPFPYLQGTRIPAFYPIALALILLVSIAAVRLIGGPFKPMRGYLDLFFMGAAFLLLETKNVVGFALYFGSTWFVNAMVFAGILLAVLAGIEVSRRMRFRRRWLPYVLLFASVAAAYAVPAGSVLSLPFAVRFLVAALLAFSPIFFANLVFSQRFRDVENSTMAFGTNLLGAMVGGLLEYAALLTGYRMLLVAVAFLYALAFVFGRKVARTTA